LGPTAGRGRWPGVIVDRFAVSGGGVILEDRSRAPARTWRADDIDAEIRGLSSVDPRARGSGRLTATVAGAPLSVDASGVGLGPLRGEVRLALRDVDAAAPVDVYRFSPGGPVALEPGRLALALAAAADGRGGSHAEAHGTLDNLVLRPHRAGAPAARAPSLMFSLTGGQAPGQPLRLDRLEVTGAATIDAKPGGPSPVTIDRLRLVVGGADGGASRGSMAARLPGRGDLDVPGTARQG